MIFASITISEAMLLQGASVVFAAGIVWSKLNSMDRRLQEHIRAHEDHPERLAKAEEKIRNLEKSKA